MDEDVKQKILAVISEIENEHPYKRWGCRETYSEYNEGWCDALTRIEACIESMQRILTECYEVEDYRQ